MAHLPEPKPTNPFISDSHRAKAARVAEGLIDVLHRALFEDGLDAEAARQAIRANGGTPTYADAIHKLDIVSRGPVR